MCVIDHDNKIIFIAVPKTGTSSVESFLRTVLSENSVIVRTLERDGTGLKRHSSAREVASIVKDYSDYRTIAVVRNPYDWYVSWYTFRKLTKTYSTKDMSLKDYLENQHHEGILSFISDKEGNIIVDHVIKYEDGLEEGITNIVSKLLSKKLTQKFPRLHVSEARENRDYKTYYNDETKAIVENLQSDTLKTFGYSF